MYRFQIIAHTQTGESIGIVGSTPELGQWDVTRCLRLRTRADLYPLWHTPTDIQLTQATPVSGDRHRVEYKYVRFCVDGTVQWESLGSNRWLAIEPAQSSLLVIDDGTFGNIQPYPFGYPAEPLTRTPPAAADGLKIVVIGSSVALGHKAWLLQGWSWLLGQTLHQAGHQVVNVSEVGANVSKTIERFAAVVAPEQPDIVIIALSLGNEGFATCLPHDRRAMQRRFESGLQQLAKMTRELGARPILGGVYPNGDYTADHDRLLWETHDRMLRWGISVLNWLALLNDGQGRWKRGISLDPAHPNTIGHRLMYQAIDLHLFQVTKAELAQERQRWQQPTHLAVYSDPAGFEISAWVEAKQVRIHNLSTYRYTLSPDWQQVQTALQRQAGLTPGIYINQMAQPETRPFFAVGEARTIETSVDIPPNADLTYSAAFNFLTPNNSNLLFHDGYLGILQQTAQDLWVINESDHEYNLQPMWQEVRSALKVLPPGVYDDPAAPHAPFRTMMIGAQGLESRVKAAPRSAMRLRYRCKLSDINRVAIMPLGDRCAVRMMLYKMEYDGPAFPFDLTRTTQIGDVADMIATGFDDMWNPAFLHYNPDAGRIYHSKWQGLSFAHEVEDTDDPIHNMATVHERMRTRYSARSHRFWYTLQHCDKVLFVRTGVADRAGVVDLVNKLEAQCQGKPFHLLLISPQSSDEFANLAHVLHYNLEFNPDRMYEDLGHWLYCTDVMQGILASLGVSSNNLFWCPPKPPREVEKGTGDRAG